MGIESKVSNCVLEQFSWNLGGCPPNTPRASEPWPYIGGASSGLIYILGFGFADVQFLMALESLETLVSVLTQY